MPNLPTADWLAALAEMDAAAAAALAGLDAREATWPDRPAPASPLEGLEARLAGWDERLLSAGRLAEDLERGFADGAAAVGRWGAAFTRWRDGIQQATGPTP